MVGSMLDNFTSDTWSTDHITMQQTIAYSMRDPAAKHKYRQLMIHIR